MNDISEVFTLSVKENLINFNPCRRGEKKIPSVFISKIFTVDNVQALLDNFSSSWAKDITILILNTGLRKRDALGIKRFDVDFENKVLRLQATKNADLGDKEILLPLNDAAIDILWNRERNGSELFSSLIRKRASKALQLRKRFERRRLAQD